MKKLAENKNMDYQKEEFESKNLDRLGIVAGIIDDIGIVEKINEIFLIDSREKINTGEVVKAIILNGLGFVSKPVYLFSQFFEDKAIEHLLGKGIKPEDLNDDKLGRVMDKLYRYGLTKVFLIIALEVVKKYKISTKYSHLDSTLKYHKISEVKIIEKEIKEKKVIYKVVGKLIENQELIRENQKSCGRFILATNILDITELSASEILRIYKQQQSSERGFRFIKDPLFFADSLFVKNPERVETMMMLMGLCLLVYNLGQRQLRSSLKTKKPQLKIN